MTDISFAEPLPEKAQPLPWTAPAKGTLTALLALVVAADVLLWDSKPGLGLVLLAILAALASALLLRPDFTTRAAAFVTAMFVLSLLPALEFIQPLSVGFAVLGLAGFVLWCASGQLARFRSTILFALIGPITATWDIPLCVTNTPLRKGVLPKLARLGRNLAVPVGLGLIFTALLAGANPVVSAWFSTKSSFQFPQIDFARILFWVGSALVLWPDLAPTALSRYVVKTPLSDTVLPRSTNTARLLLTPSAVTISLVLFNLIFGVQNLLDAQYLWFHAELPAGVTYAQYAHRGAYTLLVTALLAGGFALIIRQLSDRRLLRILLGLWIAQNLLLMVSALLRLDLYMDAYGLTRLRLAALFGTGLVAAGLMLILWQVWRRKANSWLVGTMTGLTSGALYAMCFINVAAVIAQGNLERSLDPTKRFDSEYVCDDLGIEAHAVILAFEIETGLHRCRHISRGPQVTGWRDWSFRHARMEREIAALRAER